ncbi:MAG: rhodanese-related sulfurtransferase [Cocleimonas sp.]|jgi:rhodanese-related sulfurtransferase
MSFEEIDAAKLKEMIDEEGDNLLLYDIRTPAEFQQGMIRGGILTPLNVVPTMMNDIPTDKKIVFYCRSGVRSAKACEYVNDQLGLNTINLAGGIISWNQSGNEVIKPE